jgi:HlyD family secretion protein
MHSNIRRIAPILLLTLVILAALWALSRNDDPKNDGALTASGTIETTRVTISPEIGGRVEAVMVQEGEAVAAGQELVLLEGALLETQHTQMRAGLALAQASVQAAEGAVLAAQSAKASAQAGYEAATANRDLVMTGAVVEQRQAAQAQLDQAGANLAALQATVHASTAGVRPEQVTAARLRLEQAWQTYTTLSIVQEEQTVEQARQAVNQADENLARAAARLQTLQTEPELPAYALEVFQRNAEECQQAKELAQQAYEALQDPEQPYMKQIEMARISWDIASKNLSQARARHEYLETMDDLPQAVLEASQGAVEEAQELEGSAQEAYQALIEDSQAKRLDAAWDEVQAAQRALNGLARAPGQSGGPTLETLLNQTDAARAMKDAAAANLALVESGARSEQRAAAEAQVKAAQAQLDLAEAQLQAAKAQVEMAQAQVEQAQAALQGVAVQIEKLTIKAPADGVVLARAVEPGELASPGASLLVVGQLQALTITVYIPEDRYGAILLGQTAAVSVDSYPGETFQAQVVFIADQAEFTPRNVQTAEGRRTTVFAVRLAIPNEGGKLKPGMPADVVFGP